MFNQLNLSCAQCHDDNSVAGNITSQAHPNGYPPYRLEWQSAGVVAATAQRHDRPANEVRYCGAEENVKLELYLMERARGLTIGTPAVQP